MATIVFFPEGAHGPTNNCAGIGAVLRERGHRVVFIVEESFAGTLEARGFEERLMRLGPPPEQQEAPGQFWIDFIRETASVFRKPTIEQLGEFVAPTFEALCDGARFVHDRLLEIIDELAPDVIVEDNVVSFPALAASARPWAPPGPLAGGAGRLLFPSVGSAGRGGGGVVAGAAAHPGPPRSRGARPKGPAPRPDRPPRKRGGGGFPPAARHSPAGRPRDH